ncbi:MAG: hypothetical protein ACFFCQ_17650 [Promethearchaeota archaeon]
MNPNEHPQKDEKGDYYGKIRLHNGIEHLVCPLCDKLICPVTNLESEPCHNCKVRILPPKEYIDKFLLF